MKMSLKCRKCEFDISTVDVSPPILKRILYVLEKNDYRNRQGASLEAPLVPYSSFALIWLIRLIVVWEESSVVVAQVKDTTPTMCVAG